MRPWSKAFNTAVTFVNRRRTIVLKTELYDRCESPAADAVGWSAVT